MTTRVEGAAAQDMVQMRNNLLGAEKSELDHAVSQIGCWSASLAGLLAVGWGISMVIQNIVSPPIAWIGLDAYLKSYNSIEMLNLIPSLPLASAFLVLMVSIHFYAPPAQKIWSMLGLAFAIVYAVFASINYLVQFIVVRPAILGNQTDGLAFFVMGNPNSLFWSLANSYGYMSISMLCSAWVFKRSGLERWVRWIFLIVGLTAPIQFAHTLFGVHLIIGLPVMLVWMVGVPLSCFILASLFRRYPNHADPQGVPYA